MSASIETKLLLIRHGETAWNAEGRIQGQLDVPLSPRGIWQANRLAGRLAAEHRAASAPKRAAGPPPVAASRPESPAGGTRIDAIVASDLARAWLTARAIGDALRVAVIADVRLRERDFGHFQGHTLDEIATRWPQDLRRWRDRSIDWPLPGGESGRTFIARVLSALADITQRWRGGTVAVVAHGGALDVAYRHACGLPWDAPRQHVMLNAAVNRIRACAGDGGLRLTIEAWGDIAHLDDARDELAAQ